MTAVLPVRVFAPVPVRAVLAGWPGRRALP
jgi:hypothetical protein